MKHSKSSTCLLQLLSDQQQATSLKHLPASPPCLASPAYIGTRPLLPPSPAISLSMRKSVSCSALSDVQAIAVAAPLSLQTTIVPAIVFTQAPITNSYTCLASTPPMLRDEDDRLHFNDDATQDFVACMLSPPEPTNNRPDLSTAVKSLISRRRSLIEAEDSANRDDEKDT